MGVKSLKKKPHKRSSISMASSSSSSSSSSRQPCGVSYKRLPVVFVSAVMVIGVMVLLGFSSTTWRHFAMVDELPKLYAAEVVNEFPSDPEAFTQVVNEFFHDPKAFSQGLVYDGNDTFYESTGLYGKSSVRRVVLQTGKVEVLHKMDASYFGEGLTLLGERLFQVTWRTDIGFIYDRENLSKIDKFRHEMKDGWGLATDGKVLFGSDGTSTLYHLDPQTLKVVDKHIVKYKGLEVSSLNELEFVNGEVWANVWMTDCIARISPEDGSVLGWILLQNLRKGLIEAGYNRIDVLNGIAWDAEKNRIFVTGKLWPKLYEIKLHPIRKQFHDGAIEKLCILEDFTIPH